MKNHIFNISRRKAVPFSMDNVINFHDLTFVKKGIMEYIIDGKEYAVTQGKALYVPPGSRRIRKPGTEPASYISINFNTEATNLQLPTVTDIADSFELSFYLSEIIKAYRSDSEHSEDKCDMLMSLIILQLEEYVSSGAVNKYTQKIKEFVARNIEQDISLESIAAYVHLSPAYCSHIFKKHENTTIKKYIQKLKINQACQLLLHTNHSVSYIAESLGYCDLFYFSNIFKKHTGMSPTEYRNTEI
ncbi:MAG: AraC family transcriptional regulator [Clostridia bacterium]|nr:AraC family transcriptional regulator [Clostridia bacterium]